MHKHSKTILENGLKILTIPMVETSAVSILVMANVGSRYETLKLSGISHFLEHMFFKGTKNRPNTLKLSSDVDALGAEFNAFTSEEMTGYYIKAQAKDFKISLEILYDMLYNSLFDKQEVEREKGVIAAEINMYKDNPKRYVEHLAKNLIYGDTPLGRDIAGSTTSISKFKRDDFLNYFKSYYKAENMIIAIAGKKDCDWLVEIKKYFSGKEKGQKNKFEKCDASQTEPAVAIAKRKTDQAHFVLSFRTFSRHDSRRYALEVLSNIVGGSMSSRLFIAVRERKGLAYYINSQANFYADTGDFSVDAGVNLKKINLAITTIKEEIEKIKKIKITQKELDKSKENICGRFSLSLEESLELAHYYAASELLYNKIEEPDIYCQHIRSVTAKDVQKLAKEIFDFSKSNLAIVGPFDNKEQFIKILK